MLINTRKTKTMIIANSNCVDKIEINAVLQVITVVEQH